MGQPEDRMLNGNKKHFLQNERKKKNKKMLLLSPVSRPYQYLLDLPEG